MKIKKTNNGITLIALVITIIVMLILVAVTITMAVNGGLFEYASDAGARTNEAIANEQELANLEANMTVDELINKFTGNGNDEVIPIPEEYEKSFKAGDNITAYLVESEEGTEKYDLLFIGTGEMWPLNSWINEVGVYVSNVDVYSWQFMIQNVEISYGITNVSGFQDCDLVSIKIPRSVTDIEEGAFLNCNSLTTINYTGTAEQWAQISIGSANDILTNATINYV